MFRIIRSSSCSLFMKLGFSFDPEKSIHILEHTVYLMFELLTKIGEKKTKNWYTSELIFFQVYFQIELSKVQLSPPNFKYVVCTLPLTSLPLHLPIKSISRARRSRKSRSNTSPPFLLRHRVISCRSFVAHLTRYFRLYSTSKQATGQSKSSLKGRSTIAQRVYRIVYPTAYKRR